MDVTKLAEALPASAWVPEGEVGRYAVQGVTPVAAIRPATEAEAVAAMQLAAEERWAVVPWGAGTGQERGRPPDAYDVCLSLERLSGVLEHYAEDMVATVLAGTPLSAVQAALAAHGQWWPLDSPNAAATIGGILATNCSGPRRALYGTARDHVLGMRVLYADGTVTKHGGKVVKNVAGFDLNKLHIGALGTLGIILEVSIKVQPVPAHETILVSTFPSLDGAAAALAEIAGSAFAPLTVELLNDRAAAAIVPGTVGEAAALVAVAGPPLAVERQRRDLSAALTRGGGEPPMVIDRGEVRHVWERFRDLGTSGPDRVALWGTLATLPEHVGAVASAAQRIATEHSQRLVMDARAGAGVLRLGLLGRPERVLAFRVLEAWRAVATAHHGTLVVEAAPANVRGDVDVWGPVPEAFPLMQRLKASLDPHRLLNRGRYVGGL